MKIGIPEKLVFIFVSIWIAGLIFKEPHTSSLIFSTLTTVAFGYFFNCHQSFLKKLKRF